MEIMFSSSETTLKCSFGFYDNSASYSPVVKDNANTNCGSDYIAYRHNKIKMLLKFCYIHKYCIYIWTCK